MDSSASLYLSLPLLPVLLLLLAAALSVLAVGRLSSRMRRRRRNVLLPPGSLGLPLVGETLRLVAAYKTENPEPFIDERVWRYGRVFTTHVFGEATVFSADPEVTRLVLQGEGRLFESSYPSSISTLLGRRSLLLMRGALHRRMHALLSATIASPAVIRDHLLPDIDRLVRRTLDAWGADDGGLHRVLLQDQAKKITFELTVKQLMSVDPGEWTERLRKEYLLLVEGFFSLPIPFFSFTTYGRALQARTKVAEALRSMVRERKVEEEEEEDEQGRKAGETMGSRGRGEAEGRWWNGRGRPGRGSRDLLGALLESSEEGGGGGVGFTEEEAVDFLLALLVAGYETTSTIMTLAVKFLAETPLALALLREEQEGIRARKRAAGGGGESAEDEPLDWSDYKSMPFTQCVINETLRVANIISGVFRRAVADVPIKGGYTIPKGCKVFASFRAVHMDPDHFKDARTFNPWRWCQQQQQRGQGQGQPPPPREGEEEDHDSGGGKGSNNNEKITAARLPVLQQPPPIGASVFCPFGGGPRLCPGYELARVEISVFLHYLVTRFSWEAAEEDKVIFFPTTRTLKGYPINVRRRRHHHSTGV